MTCLVCLDMCGGFYCLDICSMFKKDELGEARRLQEELEAQKDCAELDDWQHHVFSWTCQISGKQT